MGSASETWSVCCLDTVRHPPFELILALVLKFLTVKTAFMLTLPSGKQRSEVHALSGALKDKSIQLKFLPEFLVRNQCSWDLSPVVHVRSQSAILSKEDQDRLICLMHCLHLCLECSQGRKQSVYRHLLPLLDDLGRSISASSVSHWICSMVAKAYAEAMQLSPLLARPRAHETRTIASSVDVQNI